MPDRLAADRSAAPPDAEGPSRSAAARAYWDGVLDPLNLRAAPEAALPLETELAMAGTPDVEAAFDWLAGAPALGDARGGRWIVDLGAGLGTHSLWMARRGARVLAVDGAPRRLRALRRRAEAAQAGAAVVGVVAAAEALPFRDGSLGAVFTRSVLIHTDIPRAAAEIARVLAPGGRAALIEPQPGHPLIRAYRRWLAPQAWRSMTRYFDGGAQQTTIEAMADRSTASVVPFYLTACVAFAFQFIVERPRWFGWALRVLEPIDRRLFRWLPWLGRWAWFGLIKLEKRAASERRDFDVRSPSDASPSEI